MVLLTRIQAGNQQGRDLLSKEGDEISMFLCACLIHV